MKNLLVVAAPLAAGKLGEPATLRAAGLALLTFCLASGAVYLVNDVHDVAEDRTHPRKNRRPVARGDVSPRLAQAMAVLLAGAALATATFVAPALLLVVGAYLVVSLAYTWRLRREPVLEMVSVAAGFVLRASAGGAAAGIELSSWFLLVTGFGSLFLVAGKRYVELTSGERELPRPVLEAYTPRYLQFIWTAAATVTLLTYALWANEVYLVRDEGSWALWSLLPFLLGLLRYALAIDRGTAEAPEEVLWHDRPLQVIGVIWLLMVAVGAGGMDAGL